MGELVKNTFAELEKRRQRILDGGVNCIPSPFKRFADDFCGIEQATYYTITSFTKGGKSQFCSFTFIYRTIIYSYFAKEKIDFKIIYFPLEETKERILQRFMSWLLFRCSKGSIRVSPRELRSTTSALDEKIIERLKNFDIDNLLQYFEEHVIFPTESANPTGIYKYCRKYAREHGTEYRRPFGDKTALVKYDGTNEEGTNFDHYVQDNPDEYRLIIIDTINLVETEKGMTNKQSIDKLSEYCAKYLRNRYLYSIVAIQQQAFDAESNDAIKLGRIRPSAAGLGDSKYTARDSDIVLGLFSPFRFGISEYHDYDIQILRDHIRFLEVIVNRNGEMGGMIPLWFDGAICDFKELPKAKDTVAMAKIYKYCEDLKEQKEAQQTPPPTKSATTLFLSIKKNIRHYMGLDKLLNN